MNKPRIPEQDSDFPHMEKSIMTEPAEEFIEDESIPSKSQQTSQGLSSSSPQRVYDVKPAGHQNHRSEVLEPGVEG